MKQGSFVLFYVKKIIFHKDQRAYERVRLLRFSLLIIILMIPLILSLVFADGMIDGITLKYILLQNGHIQLFSNTKLDQSLITGTPLEKSIVSIDYVRNGNGIIYHEKNNKEVVIKGVDNSFFNELRKKEFTLNMEEPLNIDSSRFSRLIISHQLASTLEVGIGDNVAMITLPSGTNIKVRPSLATVVGLYTSGYEKIDESLIFIDQIHAAELFPNSGLSEIIVPNNKKNEVESIASLLNTTYKINAPVAFYSDFNREVYQNFVTSRQVILFVFFVILLISSLYIASIAHEIVEDSKQSIAMLKVLGATNRQLIASFFFTILLLTTISIFIGVLLGILLSNNFTYVLGLLQKSTLSGLNFYLLDFDVTIPYTDIFSISFTFIGIATIFVLFSLRRIMKISLLEVLQQD
ncbi:MAG: ABC transporter permease [Spirochaetia bacterium]|nr:ABC transporter permease [Spirochaetia bacterium]